MSDNERIKKIFTKQEAEEAAYLAAAKEEAARIGKEPFSVEKLTQFWETRYTFKNEEEAKEYWADMEDAYYTVHTKFMTVKEYGDYLKVMDNYDY